ncbi:hypothetical protein [Pantoea sp. 18069]|nr:hypothetical protein [Pantoea sp. 18069]
MPPGLAHRDDWELAVCFGIWALALVHALARPAAVFGSAAVLAPGLAFAR